MEKFLDKLKPWVPLSIVGGFLVGCLSLLALVLIFVFNLILDAKIDPIKESQFRMESSMEDIKTEVNDIKMEMVGIKMEINGIKTEVNRILSRKIVRK